MSEWEQVLINALVVGVFIPLLIFSPFIYALLKKR